VPPWVGGLQGLFLSTGTFNEMAAITLRSLKSEIFLVAFQAEVVLRTHPGPDFPRLRAAAH
jgi:hypothetical protein